VFYRQLARSSTHQALEKKPHLRLQWPWSPTRPIDVNMNEMPLGRGDFRVVAK
jgi:hypothetical protein